MSPALLFMAAGDLFHLRWALSLGGASAASLGALPPLPRARPVRPGGQMMGRERRGAAGG